MEIKDSEWKHVTQDAVSIQKMGSVCKTVTDNTSVLLNVRGSSITVLLEIIQHIYFSPADIMTRNIKYS